MFPPLFPAISYQADAFTFEHHRQPAFSILPQVFLVYSIFIKLDGPSRVEINCGEKRIRRRLTCGDLTIIPYRFSLEGASVEASEFLEVCLQPSIVDRAGHELGLGNHVKLVPVLGVVDPLAEETFYQLEEEVTTGLRRSNYMNLLVDTLARHLVRYYAAGTWTRNNVGGFPDYLLNGILAYIDNSRDQNLSPEEIADAHGIESDRFARAFRSARSQSIHRYLSERAERLNSRSQQENEQ
jgi:hypothetical protein